ncbi:MAG: hypothetical protein A2020_00090 [Lentisphaerae bacterium GWF2_45_14]|nr:MAG: hypothetical protein A2020_00090 [Lentisphaerae bacterium GWF2_45_14]
MRFFLKIIFAVLLTVIVSSCEYCNWAYFEGEDTRAKLSNVRIGMTKQEVLDLMGEPLKNEKFNKPDIWFYYTNVRWGDSLTVREESTPVVFSEGRVVGWGNDYYKTEYEFKDWDERIYSESEQQQREAVLGSLTEALQKDTELPQKDDTAERDLKKLMGK